MLRRLPGNLSGTRARRRRWRRDGQRYDRAEHPEHDRPRTGKDLFGMAAVQDLPCQPAQAAITRDGRLGLVAVMEFGEDLQLVTHRGRVLVIDTGTAHCAHDQHPVGGLRPRRRSRRGAPVRQREQRLGAVRGRDRRAARRGDRGLAPGGLRGSAGGVRADGEVVAVGRGESVVVVDRGTGEELRSAEPPARWSLGGSFRRRGRRCGGRHPVRPAVLPGRRVAPAPPPGRVVTAG